jgi:DNA end-binding protein Ku
MPRSTWKGAISFGLVHIPVGLYPASREVEIDFDWLDKRTLDPVGYKRINKRTGREIAKEQIVKGVKTDGDRYVVLDDDEIRRVYPKTTQTLEIDRFVPAHEVSFVFIERPYYLEPQARAEKVYALLREAMAEKELIAIGRLVMHNKEHLAALLPAGPALMLGTLRWVDEIRPADELKLPPAGRQDNGLKDAEVKMATQLIEQMTGRFEPERYQDHFSQAIRTLVEHKAAAGEAQAVEPLEAAPQTGGNVVDLTELLRRSLGGGDRERASKAGRKNASVGAASAAKRSGRSIDRGCKRSHRTVPLHSSAVYRPRREEPACP